MSIPTWAERCETHPDHQSGIVTERMIQQRMQEEIDALRAALAAPEQEPVAHTFTAPVFPPDGTVSPFTVINLGTGAVRMGDAIHDGRLPALWFGVDGQGMGHEAEMNREAHEGETLAVVTFGNVDGLDVLLDVVQRCRARFFPNAAPAPALQPAQQEPTDEQILEAAESFGEFRYGDAQGHKRIAFARAVLALRGPEIPEGWQLVPVEPTPEMLAEAQRQIGNWTTYWYGRMWAACLAAAPKGKA